MITQTDVYRRLKTEIDKIPTLDTHVHLNAQAPLTPNLAEVLGYGNFTAELTGAGAPKEKQLEKNAPLPGRERVAALVPELKRSRCSGHAWMVRQILRQAYDFQDEVTETNWEALYDTAESARQRPGRMKEICRTANVAKILVCLPPKPVAENGCDDTLFAGLCDLHIPQFARKKSLGIFEKQTGVALHGARQFQETVIAYVRRAAAAGQRGLSLHIEPDHAVVRRVEISAVEAAFDRAVSGKELSGDDLAILNTFAFDAAAGAAAEAGMVIQLYLGGVGYPSIHLPSSDPKLIQWICEFVAGHPTGTFEIYSIAAPLTHSLSLCAKYLPNVHLAGCWWFCQFPEIISSTYSLRFDMFSPLKWSAFFSDAYVAEWMIGKVSLVRKELARALAAKVLDDYMSEDHALEAARRVLFETPSRLYKLSA